jgi:hypothetical protein
MMSFDEFSKTQDLKDQLRSRQWIFAFLMAIVLGTFYVLGQYQGAGQYERSIQRQYDLMQAEQQKILDGARRSLEREGLHVEGGKQ